MLLAFLDQALGDVDPLRLESPRIAVEIDRYSGALQSIQDKEQDVFYPQAGIGFEIVTEEGTLRSEKVAAVSAKVGEVELEVAGNGPEVTLYYRLEENDHFIEKWLEITSSDGEPIILNSVEPEDMNTEAFSEIHFHDDQTIWHCPVNLFLRSRTGGCFAGLEYPYWDLKQKGKEGFRLG